MQDVSFKAAAECLKVLAHPQRLKIVSLLRNGGRTVGEIAKALDALSHVTSEHLRLMQHCRFLKSSREGRNIRYEICEPHLLEILGCIESRFSKEAHNGNETTENSSSRRVQKTSSKRRGKTIDRR